MKLLAILLFFISRIFWIFGQTFIIGLQTEFYENQIPPAHTRLESYSAPSIINLPTLASALNPRPNINFLIHNYSVPLVQLTNLMNIPYLIIPEAGNKIPFPANVFYMSSIDQLALECTQALLNLLNTSTAIFIDYRPNPQLRSLVNFLNISHTLFMVNDTQDVANIFRGQLGFNSENFYICAIPLDQRALITNLLTEAMIKGQLNPRKVWIFTDIDVSVGDFSVFLPFVNVGATIYTFYLNRPPLTKNNFLKAVVNDFISLIGQSVAGVAGGSVDPIALLSKAFLLNGNLAPYVSFDPVTHKFNGTIINIMKANSQPPQIIFTYNNIISPVQTTSVIYSLSDPSEEVRIGVVLSKGFFMQKPDVGFYGYSMDILNKLLNLTSFKFSFVFPSNSSNENQSPSQQLNLLIEQNKVDFILIPMVDTMVSNEADKSDVVLTMTINMLTRAPDVTLASVTLAPFSYNVWLGILLIIILMTFGFWAVSALNPPIDENSGNSKHKTYSFGYCFLIIYSSFAMAKLKVKLLVPSSQLFAFILWFSTLTIIITYASNLLPFLMKYSTNYPYNNAMYFINKSDDVQLNFVRNSDDIKLIQNDSVLAVLYNRTIQKSSDIFVNDLTSESFLINSSFMLIQNSFKNKYIFNTLNCTSDIFTGTNKEYPMVFAINKKWKLKEQMKALITTLISSEVASAVELIYFDKGPCARSTVSSLPNPVPLTLNKLFLLFLFPLCGCFFGVSFVILFILCGKLCRCVKNTKREKFIIGQTYDAKVSSLENTGVWAFINQRDRPYFVHSSSLHPDLRKQYSPQELEIKSGDVLHLKYFGKDPISKYKRFCKDFTDA